MINCVDGTVSSRTPILVPVYDLTGKVVAMSQVLDNLPPLPISEDILREESEMLWHPEEFAVNAGRKQDRRLLLGEQAGL